MAEKIPKSNVVNFREHGQNVKGWNNYESHNYKGGENLMDDLLQKYIEKVDRDQSDLREDIRESEKRIYKATEESEKRMDRRLDKIEQMISDQNNKIEALTEKVSEKLDDDKKYRHTNNVAIVIGVVATVISMIGIYYATVSTITNIIGMLP